MIQCQAINKILYTHNASILLINNISEEFFSDYRDEYRFIKEHLDEYGNVPDYASFLTKFPDFDVVEVTESDSYIVDELYNDRNKRQLASTFNKVRELLNDDKIDEAITLYTSAAELAVKSKHLQCVDILQDTSRYDDYVDRCSDYNKFYIKTGFVELDKVIGGWDRYEELATIVARPGVGKSWLLLKCATAALEQGLNIGIYSGEMSERKVGYRFDTLVSHISNYGITKGNADLQNDYKKYIDSLKTRYKGSFKVLTPAMINGAAGVTALRAFIEKENLDILFVDQHSLLEDDRKARDPVSRASNISRDLKNLQVLKKIPIIAVSQQNRDPTDSGLDVSHIAQADRIGQDSTVVIFIEQKEKIMTLHLAKSRDSETGKKLKYAVDLDKGNFVYIPEEDNALNGEGSEELRKAFEEEEYDNFTAQ